MKQKLLVVFLFIALFCSAASVSAMTDSERQALISQIQAQIAALQAQLIEMIQDQQSDPSWCYTFTETLAQGNSGSGVYALQVSMQKSGYTISNSEMAATFFGTSTKAAVVKFQQKYASEILTPYGYTSGTGIVGLMTRTKLNDLYGCTSENIDEDDDEETEEEITDAKCSSDYDCGDTGFTGDTFCSGGEVYQTYTTYTCKNAGKSNAYCSTGTTYKLRDTCSSSEVCSSGECEMVGNEEDNTEDEITCDSASDCGASGYIGDAFCSGGDVYKTYKTYKCNNSGTSSSSCGSTTEDKIYDDCSSSEVCSNGVCKTADTTDEDNAEDEITCDSASDCGYSGYTGDAFCSGGNSYKPYETYTCKNAGTSNSYCSSSIADKIYDTCSTGETCSNGSCVEDEDETSCNPDWDCGSWTTCSFSYQTRSCYDRNYCGDTSDAPEQYRTCDSGEDTDDEEDNTDDDEISNVNGSLSVDLKVNGIDGPVTVAKGSTVSVVWSSTDVNSCSASVSSQNTYWSGNKATSGIASVVVNATGTYYLTCTDADGSTVEDSVTINVVAVDLKINGQESLTLPYRSITPLTLTWSSSGISSCKVSSTNNDSLWSGTKTSSGSQVLGSIPTYLDYATRDGSVTYSITCTNAAGNAASDSITLTITHPTATLKIGISYGSVGSAPTSDGPLYRNYAEYFALGWTSTNSTICTKTATESSDAYGWTKDTSTSGSFFYGQAVFSSVFTLICKDSMGNTATDTVELRVCNESSFGATGFLDGVYGVYSNVCSSGNRQVTKYTCNAGRVIKRYDTCIQGCSGGICTERYYLPSE